jgi:hypothetical protein
MTQLTFHTRSAFVARQQLQVERGSRDPESPSPVPALDGNAQARMARVRRNSHTGRRRHASDQPEQRNIRPRDIGTESEASVAPQVHTQAQANAHGHTHLPVPAPAPVPVPAPALVLPYTPYPLTNTVSYRGIPPPPQLVTSNWNPGHGAFVDARSPESLASPENSTIGYSAYDSSSFTSDRNRTLSPLEYTPTQSVASYDRSISQDGLSAFLSSRTRSDSGSTSFLDRPLHHGVLLTSVKFWLCKIVM